MLVLLILWALGLGDMPQRPTRRASGPYESTLPATELRNRQAVIETSKGAIVIDLLGEKAPNHVAHFIERAKAGAYDGTTFHRVIRMAIVQGGDPLSKDPSQKARYGTGGLNELRFEPSDEKMTRGAVAAVLVPGQRDSAGSQFFICVTNQPALQGQYTVFGRLAQGIDVVEQVSAAPATNTIADERIVIRSVTIREKPAPEPEPYATTSVEELARTRATVESSLGSLTLEFFPDKAPHHVRQFLRLAASGVYDGTTIHRVVPGFVLQGGYLGSRATPLDERQQAFVRPLAPEFNDTVHVRGIVSMARGDDPASATSSFFIVLGDAPALDGKYTAFGRVVAGMETIARIEAAPVNGEAPATPVVVTRISVTAP